MSDDQLSMHDDESTRKKTRNRKSVSPVMEQPRSDPLDAHRARSLLTSVSVVRDPLHGDIRFTELERTIINSAVFQRLRHVNQLAMVDLVYPGAVHTRFLHSLGTLHVCSELIENCNNSAKMLRELVPPHHPRPVKIGYYAELLARLVALIHDAAHVPFGHVFEREAQVIKKDEWEDPWRVKKVFDSESELMIQVKQFFVEHFSAQVDLKLRLSAEAAEVVAEAVMNEVKEILTSKKSAVADLRYPFVYDLVSNTICADLIDYVQRDMYFAGLTEGLAKRFLQYIAVLPVDVSRDEAGELAMRPARQEEDHALPSVEVPTTRMCRIVLVTYRYNRNGIATEKQNLLTEAIDLVRRRKVVAEKLYFHKTKLMATSMLGVAAYAKGIDSAEHLWDRSDHEVLKWMADTPEVSNADDTMPPPKAEWDRLRAKRLAERILNRRLLKPIYRLSFHPDIDDAAGNELWHSTTGVYERFVQPEERDTLISEIEVALGANLVNPRDAIGSVSISCPNRSMQLKEFKMLVLSDPLQAVVRELQDTVKPTVLKELEAVQESHELLWRLEVFIDPAILDFKGPFASRLAGAIQHEIRPRNEVGDFRDAIPVPLARLRSELMIDRELADMDLMEEIKKVDYEQLVETAIAARDGLDIRGHLATRGYKVR